MTDVNKSMFTVSKTRFSGVQYVGESDYPKNDSNQGLGCMQHSNVLMHLGCCEGMTQPKGEAYCICDPLFGLLEQDGQSDVDGLQIGRT